MLGKPAAAFTHPNVLLKEACVHEFKHYRRGGGKFWTAAAGYNCYFAIPKSAVRLHPEPGYSYIKAQVAGVEVVFNVSGGTLNGWTDWIRNPVSISVNHPLRALRQLADAALTPEAAAALGLAVEPSPLEPEAQLIFAEQAAKRELLPRLQPGSRLVLAAGYEHLGSTELTVEELCPRKQRLTCTSPHGRVRVHYRQVGWAASLALQPN